MAETQGASKRPRKMARLPKEYKVEKRPLLRPAIPSPYTSSATTKIVYVSSRTPFMSAVKRVQKLLLQAEKRASQSASTQVRSAKRPKHTGDDDINDIDRIAAAMAENAKETQEEVVLKATGKAIAKALSMGLWFQQRAEYKVRIETGTVGAIDDIVAPEDADQEMGDEGKEAPDDIPESRIRYASTIHIFVSPS